MLAAEVVLEICRLLGEGELSQRAIADRMRVSRGTVGAIANGKRPIYGSEARAAAPAVEPPRSLPIRRVWTRSPLREPSTTTSARRWPVRAACCRCCAAIASSTNSCRARWIRCANCRRSLNRGGAFQVRTAAMRACRQKSGARRGRLR